MKKKTTWAASVVKKQLQTCCKHQTFSLETGDDCNTSQGSTQRVINISSPIRELFHHHQQQQEDTSTTPVLQRRKSFNVLHGRSLLSAGTPESLTPFRKSVESAIPLCRSSSAGTTFINKATSSSQQRLKEESEQQPVAVVAKVVPPCPPLKPTRKVVLHKSGPLPVLQQLLRNGGGVVGSSPLHVKKQLSGPLPGGRPPVAPGSSGAPSPLLPPRISKVKFSPTTTSILIVKDTSSPQCGFQPSSPEFAKIETVADLSDEEEEVEAPSAEPEVRDTEEKEAHAAALKIQAAYRGHRARAALALCERGTSDDDDDDGEVSVPSISTQMSRTDPQKQLRKTSPAPQHQQRGGLVPLRDNKGWNASIRSAQDHQALLRSRQEAAVKRERAMEYALSRQRWRSGKPASSLKPWMITPDDRVPDKPGWVRNWLERATRMDNNANPQLPKVEDPPGPPESESLSMKSTVGMCTTDIGSLPPLDNNNLGWPLSLRQQHAAGLLHHHAAATPPPPHKFPCEFSTSTTSGESGAPGDQSRTTPHLHYHRRSNDDCESVGSCDGPPVILIKVPSPAASKPRIQRNSGNSKDNKVPSREKMLHQEHPQSQVSVALSDGNSDDTTAASIQRPLWR